jgi:pimeloyl-ACP methyl ester carboxylesterase
MAYSVRSAAGKEEQMATVLIVHGAWGGGWEWTPVADELRELGHDVFVPTLTGLGERSHLGNDVALSDHLEDVLAVVAFERLRDVVMCGHSYGGMVATAAADRVPESVRGLVYLDGMVPRDGQAVVELFPPELGDGLVAAAARAEGWLYRESTTPHDLHLFDARGTAAIIDELAGALG